MFQKVSWWCMLERRKRRDLWCQCVI
ncbi:hypothetical protein LINPERPRIM_LOCUS37567 [Linum perenne]